METKPNWLVRHINLITATVTLYPWLLMILLLWDNQRIISMVMPRSAPPSRYYSCWP